jgi:signal transduction histidine kinase/ActR/RegA family two-component response regulator
LTSLCDEKQVLTARLRAIFDQAPITLSVTVLISLGTAFLSVGDAPGAWLSAWFAAMNVQVAARWIAAVRFARGGDRSGTVRIEPWRGICLMGSAFSGVLWGALPLLLWHAPHEKRVLLAAIIGGMCAGTTAVNSAYFPVVFAFLLPATLPIVASFAARGTLADGVTAAMIAIFPAALSGASLRAHRMFGQHCRLELEAARQSRELTATQARLTQELQERQQAEARLHQGQKMQAIGQLAGGIAHDINNVLQAISGAAALIERNPADAAQSKRLARMVAEAAGRGAAVTRRLLAFSRRGDLRAEPIDPAALLTDMREILSHTLGAGIGISVLVPADTPKLRADKEQLETVLINLAANARDAMNGNGLLSMSVRLETVTGSPDLAPGRYVRIMVRDTGAGMSAATLSRATEPFFTTKPKGEGTGLGLAMARGFAEQSEGALLIESTLGVGTCVNLWFPVAVAAPSPRAPVPAPALSLGRRSLLVVDDEDLVREIIGEALTAEGYAVRTAASGREGLDFLDGEAAVDLVISDLSMPGMDGLTFVKEAQRRRAKLPAIILTGFASDAAELAVGGALRGTFTLLRKPISAHALRERVALMLEAAASVSTHH